MSIKTVRNATTKQTQRNRASGGREKIAATPTFITVANNPNVVGSVLTAGTPITYRGSDHIPVGTAQYDENPI